LCNKGHNQERTKKQPTEWEKIFGNHVSDEDLISRKCKELNRKKKKNKKTQLNMGKGIE
jgi:hypothetical protein